MGLFGAIGSGLSKIGGLASKIAPVASLVPGVGTLAAAGLRAGGGILSGENVGSALKGAAVGALPGAALSKIGGLGGGIAAKAAARGFGGAAEAATDPSTLQKALALAGQVLGGENTGENISRLVQDVGLPIAGGIDRRLSRGRREQETDQLDAFFRSRGEQAQSRIGDLRNRFNSSQGGF